MSCVLRHFALILDAFWKVKEYCQNTTGWRTTAVKWFSFRSLKTLSCIKWKKGLNEKQEQVPLIKTWMWAFYELQRHFLLEKHWQYLLCLSCSPLKSLKNITFYSSFESSESPNSSTSIRHIKHRHRNSFIVVLHVYVWVPGGSHQTNTWTWTCSRSQKKENAVPCSFSLNFPQVEICSQNNLKCFHS